MWQKAILPHQHLQAQIKAKTARREYYGIIYGSFAEEMGTIDLPIGRDRRDRKKMAVVAIEQGGREAITHWQTLERIGNYRPNAVSTPDRQNSSNTSPLRLLWTSFGRRQYLWLKPFSESEPDGANSPRKKPILNSSSFRRIDYGDRTTTC